MKTSPTMQQIVSQIAKRYGVDLQQPEANLRLDMPNFDRLIIENIGWHRAVVAHYFEMNGDLVPDPDVVFYTDNELGWIPMGITQSLGGHRSYIRLDDSDNQLLLLNAAGQADLAEFTEMWARNIVAQGWLENGVKYVYAQRHV